MRGVACRIIPRYRKTSSCIFDTKSLLEFWMDCRIRGGCVSKPHTEPSPQIPKNEKSCASGQATSAASYELCVLVCFCLSPIPRIPYEALQLPPGRTARL